MGKKQPSEQPPVYAVVHASLRTQIFTGQYRPGDLLPSESHLCQEFGASRETVRRGLQQLENEGLIFSRPKIGYFVSQPNHNDMVLSLSEELEGTELQYRDIHGILPDERLQELLSKADNMADIITIESAISDTEYEIESLSGTLRHYDALVDYATVSLTLSETYKLDENEGAPLTFGARIARAFTNGLRDTGVFLEDLAIGIANNLVFLAVLAALAVVVVRAVRKKKPFGRLGKKKSKLPAGEEPKSEE